MYTRFQLGMFDPPASNPYNDVTMNNVSMPSSRDLARTVAIEGAVLLRNVGGILPLDGSKLKHVALVGPSANYSMQLVGNYPGCTLGPNDGLISDPRCNIVTPLAALSARAAQDGFNLTFAPGCDVNTANDTSGFEAALQAAAGADVIIAAMGLDTCQVGQSCSEGEANDRLVTLDFPGSQLPLLQALVAANPGTPIVLVITNGGPVSSPWAFNNSAIPAILEAWYNGEEGGNAVAALLFGDVSPAGRLPVTIVAAMNELPLYVDFTMATPPGRTNRYYTGVPLFPFGFGLSYTTFAYANMSIYPPSIFESPKPAWAVTVTVTNTGSVVSDEVVQVYVNYQSGSVGNASVPLQQLVGFQRLHGVAPGASVDVAFDFTGADIELISPAGVMATNAGQYTVWVGGGPPANEAYGGSAVLNGTLTVSSCVPAAAAAEAVELGYGMGAAVCAA
jgi:beta-glucosidase